MFCVEFKVNLKYL